MSGPALRDVGFGAIGFLDDYDKVTKRSHKGVSGGCGCWLEFVIAGIAAWLIVSQIGHQRFTCRSVNGPVHPARAVLLCLRRLRDRGRGNAVNLTDGLDGLATMPVMIAAGLRDDRLSGGPRDFAAYLGIPHVPGAGELAILCGAIMGAGLAFLWFNAPPAAVFMGDTGSLALGGALGAIAVAAHHEIVLASSAGCSWSRRCRSSSRCSGSSAPASACSRWRRSTIISNSWAGRIDRGDPLLDHLLRAGADRPVDAEAAGDRDDPSKPLRQTLRGAGAGAVGAGDGRVRCGKRRAGVAWDEPRGSARRRSKGEVELADPLGIDLAGLTGVVVSPGVPLNRHPIAEACARAPACR
jgi:hypothetical protein